MTDSVAKRIEPVAGFDAKVSKITALMGGTFAMRAAGTTYLPQFEGETDAHYKDRKNMSVLFNGVRKTVRDMVARVFEKPVVLSEDADSVFVEWAQNIDMEGRDLSNFAADVFSKGLQYGIQYLLVDAPPKLEGETARQATENNARPYIVSIDPLNVLGWKTGTIGNETVLTQIRIREVVAEDDPADEFSEIEIEQVRVFDLFDGVVRVRIYRKQRTASGVEEWQQFEGDRYIDMERITIVPFYANRVAFFKGEPLLDDLADLNIAHWQSQSDQRNILHFTRVPILFAAGLGRDEKIKVSASSVTRVDDPSATLKFVEHSGAAIAAGAADLEHLEFMMETMGLQLLVQQGGAQTATGEMRNNSKEASGLAMIADNLKDALEICFGWMAEYQNIEFNGEVVVNKDFGIGLLSRAELDVLVKAVNTGNLSRKSFWEEMKRRGVLREGLDVTIEQDLIDAETDLTQLPDFSKLFPSNIGGNPKEMA